MDFATNTIRKARETYWMHELGQFFHMVLMAGLGIDLKLTINTLMLLLNLHLYQENMVVLIFGEIIKVFPFFYHNDFQMI